jgi:hypothetical protein
MALSLRSIKWRNSLLNEKYALKEAAYKHRLQQATQLEEMLDRLHDSYLSIVKLQDKAPDPEQSRGINKAESSIKRHYIMRSVSSRNILNKAHRINPASSHYTIDSREKSMIGENSRQQSLFDLSSQESHQSHLPMSLRARALETNYNIQLSYNAQLKQQLQEAKAEASKYQELLEKLEQNVYDAHRCERKAWSSFVTEFKANCEEELILKHEELNRLHSLLSQWMTKHGKGAQTLASMEIQQILNSPPKSQPEALIKIADLLENSPVWRHPQGVVRERLVNIGGDSSVCSGVGPN